VDGLNVVWASVDGLNVDWASVVVLNVDWASMDGPVWLGSAWMGPVDGAKPRAKVECKKATRNCK